MIHDVSLERRQLLAVVCSQVQLIGRTILGEERGLLEGEVDHQRRQKGFSVDKVLVGLAISHSRLPLADGKIESGNRSQKKERGKERKKGRKK